MVGSVLILFLLSSFFFVTEIPAQKVYKYVDKDGVQHFSDAPTDPKYFSKEFSSETFGSPQDSRSKENELLKQHVDQVQDLIQQYQRLLADYANAPKGMSQEDVSRRTGAHAVLENFSENFGTIIEKLNTLVSIQLGQAPDQQKSPPKNNKAKKQLRQGSPNPPVDTFLLPAGPRIHGNEPNAVDGNTGTFYIGVKGGIINSKTGEFFPGSKGTYFSPSTGGYFHR